MSEPDDEWLDEDEDEAERVCIVCHRYCWLDEMVFLVCRQCVEKEGEGE